MQKVKDFIFKNIGISSEEWKLLEKFMKIKHYKKGDLITFKNDIWTDVLFINSGLIRSYIINNKGKDFTRQFYFNTKESSIANLFAIDFTSVLINTPSNRGFEVLADSEVVHIPKKELFHLYDDYKAWEHIGRKVAEFAYIDMEAYYNSLLTITPKDRYINLEQTMSELLNITPQYHIATFLGITPVSLSRIKKEVALSKP